MSVPICMNYSTGPLWGHNLLLFSLPRYQPAESETKTYPGKLCMRHFKTREGKRTRDRERVTERKSVLTKSSVLQINSPFIHLVLAKICQRKTHNYSSSRNPGRNPEECQVAEASLGGTGCKTTNQSYTSTTPGKSNSVSAFPHLFLQVLDLRAERVILTSQALHFFLGGVPC